MSNTLLNSADSETSRTNAQNYSAFGAPGKNLYSSPKTGPSTHDREVECCLPGAYLNCDIQTDYVSDCPIMMTQRCAKSFDDKCALYANTKAHSDTNMYRHWLRMTLERRFCRLSSTSDCVVSCTPFDPSRPNGSNLVCRNIGKEVLVDVSANSTLDVGLNLPINLSPTYQGSCQLTCDVKMPTTIEAQDPIINECIRTGYCGDILRQICQDTDVSKSSNQLLQTYCGVSASTAQQMINPEQPIGTDTYPGTYNTYTYPSGGSMSEKASRALTAIRQKLSSSSSSTTSSSVYNDDSSDYSLLYVFILLVLFYAILYLVWKAKHQWRMGNRQTTIGASAGVGVSPPRIHM